MPVLGFLKNNGLLTKERKLKFGIHNFLNSRPITYPLTEGLVDFPFDIAFSQPSELAEQLKTGKLDMAFIPSIEYARADNLRIVPGFGIASLGEVKTVLIFSKRKPDKIEKIALDNRSRTSVALLKLLFKEYYKCNPQLVAAPPSSGTLPKGADGALLIGDETFKINAADYNLYDLSKAWHELTGKPFVFALLCVADGVDAAEAVEALHKAKKVGFENLAKIVRRCALELKIPENVCKDYLTRRIRYDLSGDDIEGLKTFFQMASKNKIIDREPELRFYGMEKKP